MLFTLKHYFNTNYSYIIWNFLFHCGEIETYNGGIADFILLCVTAFIIALIVCETYCFGVSFTWEENCKKA